MQHTYSFRSVSLFFLSFIVTGALWSQVKIREKVTIAPATDTTQGANRRLVEKWKALTKNGVKINAVSPGKNKLSSLIGFANGGGLSVTVVDGASAASLDLIIRSPIQHVIVADANNNHGFTWDTTGLPGGILDIGLIWHYWGASGSEYGCSVQQVNDTTYMLGFEDTNYPPYFVDLIVKVVINPQPHDYHFDVTVIPDTIVYDDYANVSALLVDKDGNEVPLDDHTPVTLTATPENTGWFYTDNPIPYGDLKSGNVLYRAGGVEPLEPQEVTMAVDAGGITGQGKLVVTPKPCLVLQLSRTNVWPGDTVQVTFLALQYNGQPTPYPADQLFYVWMNTDESFGTLQSGWGEQGAWLLGPQPFMFIAASSISADSLVVQLEAEPSSGGIATAVRQGPKPELQKQAKASVAKLMNIIAMKVRPASKELQSVKAPTANEGKTAVPQQSNTLALWKDFRGINRTAQEGAACVPMGTVVVTKPEPTLVILEPTVTNELRHIVKAPTMPPLTAKAEMRNFSGGEVRFDWILNVKWTSPEPREISDVFHGSTQASNSDVTEWNLTWDSKIRGGDIVSLYVVATADGKTYQAELLNPFKILGDNPSVTEAKEGLTTEEQVIVYKESRPKWHHFVGDGDFPIFGKPHGYGLMQLDRPPATDEQVWNWKANKQEGQRRYDQKKSLARSYSTRINNGTTWVWENPQHTARSYNDPVQWQWYPQAYSQATTLSDGENLLKEAFQRYNGGVYWRWIADDMFDENSPGEWQKVTSSTYGDDAWSIYDGIVNHSSFPDGWNQ